MAKKFESDTPTMDEIRRLKTKHTTSVDILIDAELAAQIKALERQYLIEFRVDTKENRTPVAPGIKKQIEKLTEKAQGLTVTFTFKDLGRKKFEGYWKECPPTDAQKDEGYQWDPDAFGPIIIAKASLEPKLTLKEAKEIYNEWSTTEAETLVMTAINANMGVTSIPLSGTATGGLGNSELNLITAPIEESPTPTS